MNKGYKFFMGVEELPVSPSKIVIKINNQNKQLTLINDGEINLLKRAGLTDIEFSVLIPNKKYPFASYPNGFKSAQHYLSLLELLKNSQKPFYFRVIRNSFDEHTSIKVSLEEYTISEDADNGSDYVVDVKLKQFRDYGTEILTYSAEAKAAKAGSKRGRILGKGEAKGIVTYTVKPRDSLYKIAKTMLGDGERQDEIYELNKNLLDKLAKNHGKFNVPGKVYIYPDTVIKIRKG